MAAVYVTRADLEAVIGTALVEALFTEDADVGSEDTTRITAAIGYASAQVQQYALSKGYTIGDSLSTSSTDVILKGATIAGVIEMAYGMGKNRVPLPDGWSDGMISRNWKGILDGTLPLPSATLESISAHGGWSFTPADDTDIESTRERRTSRRNMAGF